MFAPLSRWLPLALVALAALWLRTHDLARRPMHADEANQAVKLGNLLEHGRYAFDPQDHHGPTLYYATLPVAWLRGETTLATLTETTVRLVPALAGTVEGIRRFSYDGTELSVDDGDLQTAQVTTRDIDRGAFPHFLLKEITASPGSFRKTLRGKIADDGGLLTAIVGERALPADIAVCVAAVADWRPASLNEHKIKKEGHKAVPTFAPFPGLRYDAATHAAADVTAPATIAATSPTGTGAPPHFTSVAEA